jgi:bacterial/archaeal transporter family-2 protein
MPSVLYLLAFTAGVVLIVQVGVNSTLRSAVGNPVMAALISFVIGSVGLLAFLLLIHTPWPDRAQLSAVPGWAWLGGLLGAFYVVSTIMVGPRIGAAALLALIVLGQLATSLLVDHFGWLGFPEHPVTPLRLLGALMLFGGMLLIVQRD